MFSGKLAKNMTLLQTYYNQRGRGGVKGGSLRNAVERGRERERI
jgi:hypothetical protein